MHILTQNFDHKALFSLSGCFDFMSDGFKGFWLKKQQKRDFSWYFDQANSRRDCVTPHIWPRRNMKPENLKIFFVLSLEWLGLENSCLYRHVTKLQQTILTLNWPYGRERVMKEGVFLVVKTLTGILKIWGIWFNFYGCFLRGCKEFQAFCKIRKTSGVFKICSTLAFSRKFSQKSVLLYPWFLTFLSILCFFTPLCRSCMLCWSGFYFVFAKKSDFFTLWEMRKSEKISVFWRNKEISYQQGEFLSPGQGTSLVVKSGILYKNRSPKIAISFLRVWRHKKRFAVISTSFFHTFWPFLALLTRVLSILWPGWNPLSFLPPDKKSPQGMHKGYTSVKNW